MKTTKPGKHKQTMDNFYNNVVHHEKFLLITNRLLQFIQTAPNGSIAFVTGPTGVGKTTLMKRVLDEMNNALEADSSLYPDLWPVVDTEIPSPDSGNFNWRDCYTRILNQFNEPLIHEKKMVDHKLKILIDKMSRSDRQFYAPQYRFAVEQCLQHKQPIALFLDEGQHFTKISSGRRLQDQLDTIKSIANISNTTIILFGTYELLDLANLSGQLARRTEIIHFDRYRYDIADEKNSFIDLAYSILQNSPLNTSIDPVETVDEFYIHSLGCGGILKDWIGKAISMALINGDKILTNNHLKQARFTEQALSRIATEIIQGEEFFKVNKTGLIQKILGLNFSNPGKNKNSSTNKLPGKRNPTRDSVST